MTQEIAILSGNDLIGITRSLDAIEEKMNLLLQSKEAAIPPKWIKAPAVCKYFGFSRVMLDRIIAEGKIKAYHINGRLGTDRYFKLDEIYSAEDSIFV